MGIKNDYKHTVLACYIGYITQAVVNNFAPLLFVTFHDTYNISLKKLGLLVSVNFVTQLTVDLLSAVFADKIGYRRLAVAAHLFAAAGLVLLGILPDVMPSPFAGVCTAAMVYAVGGGLTEVIISPIIEACPSDDKASAMSLLHSFYCWGSVLVVLVSTVMFGIFGIESWKGVAVMWAVIPALNSLYFSKVPINTLSEERGGMSVKALLGKKVFWQMALLMMCAGASELAMSQWASAFAESGLKVSKAAGDLMGPCLFAVLMGSSRILHSRIGSRVSIHKYLSCCAVMCAVSYITATLSPLPVISLIGCGLCGFSVGAMWPGTFSLACVRCPSGGTAMFALLALAGDLGCSAGPAQVGIISSAFGDDLKKGLLAAVIFPAVMLIALASESRNEKILDRA